jgi:D-alanyl-lipoteichoic acid acyltransferase DltB (MBOAT superfamily)
MLFNSLEFLVFLVLVLVGYFLCIPRGWWRARKAFLVVASYLFYMNWNPYFGLLLLASTLVDFFLAQRIERTQGLRGRRALLAVSVIVNLGVLGFFKYGNFVATTVTGLLHPLVGDVEPPLADLVLPVGISFYTFESLSYSIDVFRGMPAYRSLLDFALFLSFFPHLVAGPIVRPRAFLPQLATPPSIRAAAVEDALVRIACGLVKKVAFADTLGTYVDVVFAHPGFWGGPNLLLAIYAYAFQIYFDFSGYTDIALGLAGLFGLKLPENFDRPYLAAGPREFWQRWHISLSTWLRDYLYISLGGSRISPARTTVNLMVTMVLGGLWHGAAWTFVVWGAYHGVLLVIERLVAGTTERPRGALATALRRVLTFHLVCAGWVLFRAPTLADAWSVFGGLATWRFELSRAASLALVFLVVAAALHVLPTAARFRQTTVRLPPWAQGVAYGAVAVLLFLFSPASERFIYFQF